MRIALFGAGRASSSILLVWVTITACRATAPTPTSETPVVLAAPVAVMGAPIAVSGADPATASGAVSPAGKSPVPVVPEVVRDDPFWPVARYDLPAPSRVRSASGEPGPDYWQQRADYTIDATLDTATHTVRGTVTIRYVNNAPDTLRWLWMQVDQNVYHSGSKGSVLFGGDARWSGRDDDPNSGGYRLDDLLVDGRAVLPHIDDTMMRLDLERPIAPRGGVATITMRFAFRVPTYGSDRMARDGSLYEIAQWYPRMAVYDDVRGWNTDPYLGQGEFYLEYGDIDYAITAPAGYTIAGSGVLQNAAQVLPASQRARLAFAARSDSVVAIIPAAESKAAEMTGTRTWRFRATNVRDVAWAGAPDFQWDATSRGGVLCQALYEPSRTRGAWAQGAEQTCWAIATYSQLVAPYPYPQATSVAGPVGGMEYPMFVMVEYGQPGDPASVFETIDHEHGHEWFPMLVGSNERRYAWMDEGLNTLINTYSIERRTPGHAVYPGYVQDWRMTVDLGVQAPLMLAPDRVAVMALGSVGYEKPGATLLSLRNHVLGPATFDRALREYARRWSFKHPTPGDFFRTIENVSGMDLSWFWRGFFYGTDVLDIGIDAVVASASPAPSTSIVLRRTTSIPYPVTIRLKHADGSIEDRRLPVEIWSRGARFTYTVPSSSPVIGARLWPAGFVPDFHAANDTWGDAPAANPVGPATAGGLTTPIGRRGITP